MLPAKPPLPTPWYLPFQPVTGIHTSILISESLAGLSSAVTRQKAGASLNTAGFGAGLGNSNAPAATTCADVMVVSGSLSVLKLSHVEASAGDAAKTNVSRLRRQIRIRKGTQFTFEAFERFSTFLSPKLISRAAMLSQCGSAVQFFQFVPRLREVLLTSRFSASED